MSGIRARKKQLTRKAILSAAIRLFGEKGYEKTSIEDLAREAGIGKATVYGYFKAKDEIFQAFCEEEIDYIFEHLKKESDPEAPLLEQMLTLFMMQFRYVTENREFGRHFIREMAFPKEPNESSRENDQRYLDALGEILGRAQATGEIRPDLDLFIVTGHFYFLYQGILSGWYTGYLNSLEEVEETLRTLFVQVMEGIGK